MIKLCFNNTCLYICIFSLEKELAICAASRNKLRQGVVTNLTKVEDKTVRQKIDTTGISSNQIMSIEFYFIYSICFWTGERSGQEKECTRKKQAGLNRKHCLLTKSYSINAEINPIVTDVSSPIIYQYLNKHFTF